MPDPKDIHEAMELAKQRLHDYLFAEGPVLMPADLAEKLGIPEAAVTTMLATGEVFGIIGDEGDPLGRKVFFPSWVVHEGVILDGIPQCLAILRSRGYEYCLMHLAFFAEPQSSLGGLRVLDALRQKNLAAALELANRWER